MPHTAPAPACHSTAAAPNGTLSRRAPGVKEELIPLLTPKTPTMTIEFAKALHKAGYRSLAMVAASDEKKLVQALRQQGTRGGGRVAGSYKHVERSAKALHEEALKVETERDQVSSLASTDLAPSTRCACVLP